MDAETLRFRLEEGGLRFEPSGKELDIGKRVRKGHDSYRNVDIHPFTLYIKIPMGSA